MSTQKGNDSRTRAQKHKNRSAFKNTLHDTSHRTKFINSIVVSHVCQRCKDIIEWKIKYKKYKPLTQAKKCIKCDQRNVKQAYHVMCGECGKKLQQCTKCCQSKEIVANKVLTDDQLRNDQDIQGLLQMLPERKRRTFIRYMNNKFDEGFGSDENGKDVLMAKLKSLDINEDDDNEEDEDDDEDKDDDDEEEEEK